MAESTTLGAVGNIGDSHELLQAYRIQGATMKDIECLAHA